VNQALKLCRYYVQMSGAELPPSTNHPREREAYVTVSLCPEKGGNKQTNNSLEECVSVVFYERMKRELNGVRTNRRTSMSVVTVLSICLTLPLSLSL